MFGIFDFRFLISDSPSRKSIDLVVATRNEKKLVEIRALLADLNFNVMSIGDFACIPEVREDGNTFEENARKKAAQIAQIAKRLTLADDSGLEIDYLGGQPGVRSARFTGENATDEDRNRKVLHLLEGVPRSERKARFRCAIAIASPDAGIVNSQQSTVDSQQSVVNRGLVTRDYGLMTEVVTGTCEGEIAFESRGNEGFGYDPIFVVPAYGKTFAELGVEKKNQISHRAMALRRAKELLRAYHNVASSICRKESSGIVKPKK
jgi:XTP/dITP diphosphohydrolase